jgi:two-component system nitrate/nitrite response regulator NarL
MKNRTCLIVDDHILFAQGLTDFIARIDRTIHITAVTGYAEAQQALREIVFDYVFVDIHLGDKNGRGIVETSLRRNREAFCIAISGDENTYLAKSMIRSGAKCFISKASSEIELQQAIAQVLDYKISVPAWLLEKSISQEDKLCALPKRLLEISHLIVSGASNKEIAMTQSVTENSVKSQIKRLYAKTDVSNRAEFASRFASALRNLE